LIGGLIVTHGRLAHELLNAANTIEGDLAGIEALSLEWNDTVDEARTKIRQALGRFDKGTKVIIFTDMFGGTPSNLCLSFLERGEVEIVTGVNLPMVVKFASLHAGSRELSELAHLIRDKGSNSIRVASDFLSGENGES
jgi:PTS system mannose-specific IIA component